MKYNNTFNDSDITSRELSLDPIPTGSGSLYDDGTDVIELYNSSENKIEKLIANTNIRLNISNIINTKNFKTIEEIKNFNNKIINDLDEFLLSY